MVPIDLHKKDHVVQFCNGLGGYLSKKFLFVRNDSAGADYLLDRVKKISRKYGIATNNVVIGGEDPKWRSHDMSDTCACLLIFTAHYRRPSHRRS